MNIVDSDGGRGEFSRGFADLRGTSGVSTSLAGQPMGKAAAIMEMHDRKVAKRPVSLVEAQLWLLALLGCRNFGGRLLAYC
jgi:hypothetical protein